MFFPFSFKLSFKKKKKLYKYRKLFKFTNDLFIIEDKNLYKNTIEVVTWEDNFSLKKQTNKQIQILYIKKNEFSTTKFI